MTQAQKTEILLNLVNVTEKWEEINKILMRIGELVQADQSPPAPIPLTQETREEIYRLMEAFANNPSNRNKYYQGLLALIELTATPSETIKK